MDFKEIMDVVSRGSEVVGIGVLVVGLIVLIRTFLSFSLETEIEGIAPWRRWCLLAPGAPPLDHRNDTG